MQSKWNTHEENTQRFIQYLEDSADQSLLKGGKFLTAFDKEQLEAARKDLRPAFDEFVKYFFDPMQEIEHRSTGFRLLVNLLVPVFDTGMYGFVTRSAKNFFAPIVISEIQSRAGKASWNERREDYQALQKYGLKLANEIRATKPHLSQSDLAEEMRSKWKVKPKLKLDTLVEHISAWENAGLLPKRVPKPKEPARRRN